MKKLHARNIVKVNTTIFFINQQFLNTKTKLIKTVSRFKKTIKKQILNFENEIFTLKI